MSLKVNTIVWLQFELAYYDIAVQQVSHTTTVSSSYVSVLVIFVYGNVREKKREKVEEE